jgi:nitroreductase
MNISKAIEERFSCRSYRNKKISDKSLNKILEAGIRAPNAGNLQAWKFVLVNKEDVKEQITKAALDQRWMMQAPVFIVVCSNLNKLKTYYPGKYRLYAMQDTSLAAENIILMAYSLKIKSCFIGAFDEKAVSRILRLPDDIEPYSIITLGYSDEKGITKRNSLNYSLSFNKYGSSEK